VITLLQYSCILPLGKSPWRGDMVCCSVSGGQEKYCNAFAGNKT